MNNNEDKIEPYQDPVQYSIDERLKKARYKLPARKKKPSKYEKLQMLTAVVMALGIVTGLITIVIQFFIK
ncbi:accessory secretory protein Asp4 [Leuconostoc mesenteroides]